MCKLRLRQIDIWVVLAQLPVHLSRNTSSASREEHVGAHVLTG